MKNSRICPKCNARNIIRVPGVMEGCADLTKGFRVVTKAHMTRYICGVCGYSEEWIDNAEDLRQLKEKFG